MRLGASSTGPIAKESQVSRSKLYSILDRLEKKGLVSHVDRQGVIYFQAGDPVKIKDYLKDKENNIRELQNNFEEFLPELESFYKNTKKVQKVNFYQGFKGLINVHEHTYQKLKKGDS